MSEDTLFATDHVAPTAEPTTDQVVEPAQPTINIPAEAAELIGEGKKYATVEAALAALPHAQNHITQIENENKEFKERLIANDKLDQVLHKLNSASAVPAEPTAQPSISREELSELVQQEMEQVGKVNQEKANRTAVETKLREVYNEEAGKVFNERASDVGMTPAQLTALAKVAPEAVLTLVGVNKSGASAPTPTTDGLNLSNLPPQGTPPKKNIMFGASTKDVIDEWKASAPIEN